MILKTLLWVVAYIIVTLINRKLYINIQKINKDYYPNPMAIFTCFFFLLGTWILLLLYILEYTATYKKTSFVERLFKYTPKENDKKIRYDEEDRRGWDGC